MVKYTPIEVGETFKTISSDLHRLWLTDQALTADFRIPADTPRFLRVEFEDIDVMRVLDEMPLSTEEAAEEEGLVSEHFAYTVEGSLFWNSQSDVLTSYDGLQHYRFITGWRCLDVLSRRQPRFSIVTGNNA